MFEEGGDPACWAHLFDEESGETTCAATGETVAGDPNRGVDLPSLAVGFTHSGTAWTLKSDDLNANLLVLNPGGRSSEYVNETLDVLIIAISGAGVVTIDGDTVNVGPGHAVLAPKGSNRSIRALDHQFAYLTCHRKRGGLWPTIGAHASS
jgi:mannose-6-phosphate isomerase-like protein (cupin superfamily)